MDMPTFQGIVNSLAQDLDLPVVLEDAEQQPLAHSPHYGLTDQIRRDTIMRHATGQGVVDYFRDFDLGAQSEPFVVPGDADADILPRLCIPVRHHDLVLGYAWVLLPEGQATTAQMRAAREAGEALTTTMRLERHARAREAATVEDLLSTDPERRLRGLVDVEGKAAFEAPRRCVVLVCSGQAWAAASTRHTFHSLHWVPDPASHLRTTSPDEGVAVLAVDPARTTRRGQRGRADAGGLVDDELDQPLDLAAIGSGVDRLRRVADGASVVIGVGQTVATPSAAHLSYRRARQAARVAMRSGHHAPVASWATLGVYRHLSQMPSEMLAEGIDPRLTRMIRTAPEVAATLEAYLEGAGAIAQVADALHIHRSTLYYRLEKVADAGVDLQSGADRMAMHTGFAAMRLLGLWPAEDR